MHIAHTISSIANPAAGPSYSVPSLASAQAELADRVEVLSTGRPGPRRDDGVTYTAFPDDFAAFGPLAKPGFSRGLKAHLARCEADVIHSHGLWSMAAHYALRAPGGAQPPLRVVAPRGMMSETALGYSRRFKRLYDRLYQRKVLEAVGLFHATSTGEMEEIRACGLRQPVAVVPNGVPVPDLVEKAPERTRFKAIYIGRIHRKKGLTMLVEAWADLEARFPDWELDIVGPDENEHSALLARQIEEHGLERVHLRPPVFGEEKDRALAAADLFILPTLSENFAMAVAESLAAGTPVVSSKGAPWSGLEEHGAGWWVDIDAGSIGNAMAEAMALLPSRRAEMGLRGRRWMQDSFAWQDKARKLLAAYEWALHGGERPDFVFL